MSANHYTLRKLVSAVLPLVIAAIKRRRVARYVGERQPNEDEQKITTATPVKVTAVLQNGTAREIDPCLRIRNHSPSGFNWGYGGSGPSQLALAILADFTGSGFFAERHYMEFKLDFLAGAQSSRIEITADQLSKWVNARLEATLAAWLGTLFDAHGEPCQLGFLDAVSHGPEFNLEFTAQGDVYRLDLTDRREGAPARTRIDDLAQFFADEVFLATPIPEPCATQP